MPTTYAIPNGRTVMDATTYTANGGVQTVNNSDTGSNGFYPDFIWTKPRSITANHQLVDSVRGSQYFLYSNLTNTEGNNSQFVTGFNSNGFGLGTANYGSGTTMVAWQWNAGSGTTSTNTNGNRTSTVSVNNTAGFSIVSYVFSSSGTNTIGHGLSTAPAFILMKDRNTAYNWDVYHVSLGYTQRLILNDTSAASGGFWAANPTSTVFSVTSSDATNGDNLIAYCWAPVAGFSAFGSYTGNGSADGPFIYTGFRPKFVLFRITSSTGNWDMLDTSRNPYNLTNYRLFAESSSAELTGAGVDILSNGFKIRNTDTSYNSSGANYIYAAFAENPFKYANAR